MRKGKWFVSVMLAAVCCFVALSFTACGDDEGDTTAQRSEKVADEAAWRAAFDYSETTNYEFNAKAIWTDVDGTPLDDPEAEWRFTSIRDGYRIKEVDNESDDETKDNTRYYRYAPDEKWDSSLPDDAQNNGTVYYYFYDEESSGWYYIKESFRELVFNSMYMFDAHFEDFCNNPGLLSNRYNEFHYDEERGLYVLTIDEIIEEEDDYTTIIKDIEVTVFIQNGKVVKGTSKRCLKGEDGEPDLVYDIICTMSKIGECSVTIPSAQPAPNN